MMLTIVHLINYNVLGDIMNKLFENTTTYTSDVYREFVEFHNKKYNLNYNLYTLFMLALIVFCMVLQFSYSNVSLGILFLLIMIVFLIWRVFHPFFFVKKEANSDKVKKQLTNTYSFYDNYIEIKNDNDSFNLRYFKLHKVFETENNFYLYINKNYSFVLDKNGFSIGNPDLFYDFIKKKIWYKVF